MIEAISIWVKGIVQGVGFRPFVYQAAAKHRIQGWVLNAKDGVRIHAEGSSEDLDAFILALSNDAPSASCVQEIELTECSCEGYEGFDIRHSSDSNVEASTLVSPDLVICESCKKELCSPEDRRYSYPFINCTECGPRFSIIEKLPYDRVNTSMKNFALCKECQEEYDNPLDRRFHAQPNACKFCGPSLFTYNFATQERKYESCEYTTYDILKEAGALIRQGGIVALKGLGGYHLVCDADNSSALAKLRERKKRPHKPFALMASTVSDIRQWCEVSPEEEKALASPASPIVLLAKKPGVYIPVGIADGFPEIGFMLPTTPLQLLLIQECGGFLVMTSANRSSSPIIADDEEAISALSGIADLIVGHNRAIVSRFDDSVLRVLNFGNETSIQMIRRSRGFAPTPIPLPQKLVNAQDEGRNLLALGAEQKNTFTFTQGNQAFVSQHMGDLISDEAFDNWFCEVSRYEELFSLSADELVGDIHPRYQVNQWAKSQNRDLFKVAHHHAHIASVLGEHNINDPVIGFAFDGTGVGVDGSLWGGEVLLSNMQAFERFASFSYFPLIGSEAAIKDPLRISYGLLWACDLLDHPVAQAAFAHRGQDLKTYEAMIEEGINCPVTSSLGRIFDAVSALLGICPQVSFEGQAAQMLEGVLFKGNHISSLDCIDFECYKFEFLKNTAQAESTAFDTSVLLIDPKPVMLGILDDIASGVPASYVSYKFHEALVELVVVFSNFIRSSYGITTVALGGGVFMNRYLTQKTVSLLSNEGFTVALPKDLPCNDGGISYGQAVVALARDALLGEEKVYQVITGDKL